MTGGVWEHPGRCPGCDDLLPDEAEACARCGAGERASKRRRRTRDRETLLDRFDHESPGRKLLWVFITLAMGAPGGGLFAYLFFAAAFTEVDWSRTSRMGMAAGGVAALAVATFLALAGVRAMTGPHERLDQLLNRLKWPFYLAVLAALGYVLVAIAIGMARGAR